MSTTDKHPLTDMLALSMQLSRQAYAQPPIDGWAKSFLAMLMERLAGDAISGVQLNQVIGNMAVQVATAGRIPAEVTEQQIVDETSPIRMTLRSRAMTTTPTSRIYPVVRGDDSIGVLIAYLSHPGEIIPKTADLIIASLALQLGPALFQPAKLPTGPQTGRLRNQVDVMRSLYEVTRTFNSELESVDVARRAAQSLVEMLKNDHTSVYVFNQGVGQVIAEYPDNAYIGTKIQLPGFPIYEALQREGRPVTIRSIDDSTKLGLNKELFQKLGVKAMIVLPMFVQEELIGAVSIEMYYNVPEFNLEDIENAMAVSSQLAVSVRNAQLYDQIKERANQLERITELSRQVNSTFDRNRIFQIVRAETHKLLDAGLLSVALRQNDGTTLEVYILDDQKPIIHRFVYEEAALRFVCNTAEPLVLDDISGSDYPDYKLFSELGMRSAVIVPLVIGGDAIGTYNVMHSEAGLYASLDLVGLEQIGHQLAIALENARLYAQTVQRVEGERLMNRLSGGIQGSGDLNAMLLSTVQEMAEALGARRARLRLQTPTQGSDTAKIMSASAGKLLDKLAEKFSEKRES